MVGGLPGPTNAQNASDGKSTLADTSAEKPGRAMSVPMVSSWAMIWRRRILFFLLVFQGLSGCLGGLRLVADPSGASIELPLEWLAGSVFSNYRVPGLVLLIVLGFGPLVAAYGVWRRRPWGWTSSFVVGAALIIWLAIQIRIIGYHPNPPLQLAYGLVACAMAVLAVLSGRDRGAG